MVLVFLFILLANQMKIVIPEKILPESLDQLRAENHVIIYDPQLVSDQNKLLAVAHDADAKESLVIRSRVSPKVPFGSS